MLQEKLVKGQVIPLKLGDEVFQVIIRDVQPLMADRPDGTQKVTIEMPSGQQFLVLGEYFLKKEVA